MQNTLLDADMGDAVRVPAFDKKWIKRKRRYHMPAYAAHALGLACAVHMGWRRRVRAVLIFEDDVILAPDLRERLADIELPQDWAVFYLGCKHIERPTVCGPGLLRVRGALDLHAFAVHEKYFGVIRRAMLPAPNSPEAKRLRACDEAIQHLAPTLPMYATWPNLAWQRKGDSTLVERSVNSSYSDEGRQLDRPEVVAGLNEEMDAHLSTTRNRKTITPMRWRASSGEGWLNWQPLGQTAGLSERVCGISSMATLAATEGKTLRVLWEPSQYCPGGHDQALESHAYQVVRQSQEWERLTRGQPVEATDFGMLPRTTWELARRTRRALPSWLTEAYFAERWRREVRRIRPSRGVLARVVAESAAWRAGRALGVFISRAADADPRIGVDTAVPPPSALSLFSRVIDRCENEQFDMLFLAGDDRVETRRWEESFLAAGLRVFNSEKTWISGQFRQTTLEDSAVDLFLLARCDSLISVRSIFAWVGAEIGGIACEIIEQLGLPGSLQTDN